MDLTQDFDGCLSSLDEEFVIKEFRFDTTEGDEFESQPVDESDVDECKRFDE